mgnify:CR=1 FL=1
MVNRLFEKIKEYKTIIIHTVGSESGQDIFNKVININDLEYVDL